MARAVQALLVEARRRPGGTPGPDGQGPDRERKEEMTRRDEYVPGPAKGADVRKEGEKWTLVLVRDLGHAPEKVWRAITEPEHLREWAPFDSDRTLGAVGTAKLTTVGAPSLHVTETRVKRADPPRLLEFSWGG